MLFENSAHKAISFRKFILAARPHLNFRQREKADAGVPQVPLKDWGLLA